MIQSKEAENCSTGQQNIKNYPKPQTNNGQKQDNNQDIHLPKVSNALHAIGINKVFSTHTSVSLLLSLTQARFFRLHIFCMMWGQLLRRLANSSVLHHTISTIFSIIHSLCMWGIISEPGMNPLSHVSADGSMSLVVVRQPTGILLVLLFGDFSEACNHISAMILWPPSALLLPTPRTHHTCF